MDCAINFCPECSEIHLRQKSTSFHEVLTLDAAREKGITKVRRQVMCLLHPNSELALFCSTCYHVSSTNFQSNFSLVENFKVVCTECKSTLHRNHVCEPVSKVAKSHIVSLRMAANKAKALIDKSAADTSVLSNTSKRIEAECSKVCLLS